MRRGWRLAGGSLLVGGAALGGLAAADRHYYGGGKDDFYSDDVVAHLACLPLRTLSRALGAFAAAPLPKFAREPIFRGFCGVYGCNVDECQYSSDLSGHYSSLADFFVRKWREETRTWDNAALLCSPCDGKLVSCGEVGPSGSIGSSVKGRRFDVRGLLGAQDDHEKMTLNAVDVADRSSNAVRQAQMERRLFYAVIYLSPGDFHRFSCPVEEWFVKRRRHISGMRLPVHAGAVARVPDLFAVNERVAWLGTWEYGMFSMVAVGALNVGSVEMTLEGGKLTGPAYGRDPFGTVIDETQSYRLSRLAKDSGLLVKRGREVGAFHFGSSVVLVFEAPTNKAEFTVTPGDAVRVGQGIFRQKT